MNTVTNENTTSYLGVAPSDDELTWGLEMALEAQRERRIFGPRRGASSQPRARRVRSVSSRQELAVMAEMAGEREIEEHFLAIAHPNAEDRLLHRVGECDGSCARYTKHLLA